MLNGICNICGRAGVLHTCPLCGRMVCDRCLLRGVCVECSRGRMIR